MENEWLGSRESRKRSLAEMSQSHPRISSSPELFRESTSNLGNSSSRIAPPNVATSSLRERPRRRSPNPNNNSSQSSLRSRRAGGHTQLAGEAGTMEASTRRPVVNSENVIDLTSDQDDDPSPPVRFRPGAARMAANRRNNTPSPSPSGSPFSAGRVSAHNRNLTASRPPPRLGRSEARLEQFVDLTGDDDDEDDTIIITHSRERSVPLAPRAPPLPPMHHARLGVFERLQRQRNGRATPPGYVPGHYGGNPLSPQRPTPAGPNGELAFGGLRNMYDNGAGIIMGVHNFLGFGGRDVGVHLFADFPAMPNGMDYGRVALQENKPEHVAPPAVPAGFTRSPTESDTAICPSCEEELIHRKDGEEPVAKKSRGAPSKKDREEHPFWVVKDCGHVFCNKCFQNRTNDKISSFRGAKTVLCAVDECESIVRNKDRWVGIFL
ncbi:uncharacterized protein EAF01_003663 [Botrytis porri]|uniref:Uncharacterized protein n=1 Tax=Botrytis porri TaxID=87229 RepID=A0A4Z1KF56_9HELO|nr:uncharacterized protein EAF01_003663 [Botrytis porri]KAF7909945.1 hypothetical protein EAF01_003663 [Botrytis porri]TGO82822.1 hypothetical protein BPOR_0751g00010 [Botrytis porri]